MLRALCCLLAAAGPAAAGNSFAGRPEAHALDQLQAAARHGATVHQAENPGSTAAFVAYSYEQWTRNQLAAFSSVTFASRLAGTTAANDYLASLNYIRWLAYTAQVWSLAAFHERPTAESQAAAVCAWYAWNDLTYALTIPPPAPAATPVAVWHGGKVLGNVRVVPVFIGSYWTAGQGAADARRINGFYAMAVDSSLLDMLGEYGAPSTPIGRGTRTAAYYFNPTTGPTIDDTLLQADLRYWIQRSQLPTPDANTLYCLHTPPGVAVTAGGQTSGVDFGAYHDFAAGAGPYAVVPYPDGAGTQALDYITAYSSHELAEAVTDPYLDAWLYFDPAANGNRGQYIEIGDMCEPSAAWLNGYLVSTIWSNRQGACAVAP